MRKKKIGRLEDWVPILPFLPSQAQDFTQGQALPSFHPSIPPTLLTFYALQWGAELKKKGLSELRIENSELFCNV